MTLGLQNRNPIQQDNTIVISTKAPMIIVYQMEVQHQNSEFTKKTNQKQSHDSDSSQVDNYKKSKWNSKSSLL